MKIIGEYVHLIDEELEGAKNYAEKYVYAKSQGENNFKRWNEMAQDELKHALYIHEVAVQKIAEIEKVFKPTVEMQDMWDRSHVEYVEKTAWIKKMLEM